jgi:glycosyltransferase involved in cell wall biosynthesis
MRIGINTTPRLMTGGGRTFITGMLSSWEDAGVTKIHEIVVITHRTTWNSWSSIELPTVKPYFVPLWAYGPLRIVWEQLMLPSVLRRLKVNVLFCPFNTMPFWSRTPCVVMFTNAAPFLPGGGSPAVSAFSRLKMVTLRALMIRSASRAASLVFISHHFLQTLGAVTHIEHLKVHIIPRSKPELVDLGRSTPSPHVAALLGTPYILTVGSIYRYKRYDTLVSAFAALRRSAVAIKYKLLIVGDVGDPKCHAELKKLVDALGIADAVEFIGTLDHASILFLMRHSACLVMQSTCENCPNVLIEGLATGAVVVSSHTLPMPEIGGDACLYYDPLSVEDAARAIATALEDSGLRRALRTRAHERMAHWPSSTDVARSMLKILVDVAERAEVTAGR